MTLREVGGGGGDVAAHAAETRADNVHGLDTQLDAVDAALAGKQPLDGDLTAIAALASTGYGRSLLELADAAAGRTALGLGTAATHAHGDYDAAGAAAAAQAASQPLDGDLTAIAALATTGYGRGLLEVADAAAGRTALGLGTAATHAHGDYDAAGAAAAAQAASQPLDADLTAMAALSTTAYGRALLELADAAAARAAIGAQPLDADLTALAALTTTAYGRGFLELADAAAARTLISAQPLDADLTAIAALSTAAFGRSLLEAASAAAARTTLAAAGSADLTAHEADTTAIHGIADTTLLALLNAAQTFTQNQRINAALAVGMAPGAAGTIVAQNDIAANADDDNYVLLGQQFDIPVITFGAGELVGANTGVMELFHYQDSLLIPAAKMINLQRAGTVHQLDPSGLGVGVGDKLGMFGDASFGADIRYGFGLQAARLVAYIGTGGAFGVRQAHATASVQASTGAEVFSVAHSGLVTCTGRVTGVGDATGATDAVNRQTGDARYAAISSVPNASYRTILDSSGSLIAGQTAGTYGLPQGQPFVKTAVGVLYPLNTIYIDDADFPTLNAVAAKLRIRAQLYTNDVAPTGNFTVALHPISRPATSGGAGLNIYTIGAAVAGSAAAVFTTPAADGLLNQVGSDFAIPADGHYCIGVVTTATVATSSLVHISASLQMRNA